MRKLIGSLVLLILVCQAGVAEEKLTPSGRARVLAPFLDDQTVAIIRVDLARLDLDALQAKIPSARMDVAKEFQKSFRALLSHFTNAGGKEVFIVFNLADWPRALPFLIFPVAENIDSKTIQARVEELSAVDSWPFKKAELRTIVTEKIDNVIFRGTKATRERLRKLQPAHFPELQSAFAADDNSVAQLVVLASRDTRRVIEETLPLLPPEVGGVSSKILTQGIQWAAVSVKSSNDLSLKLVIESKDAQAAQNLRGLISSVVNVLDKGPIRQEFFPHFDTFVKQFTPEVAGNRLTLGVDESTLMVPLQPLFARVLGSFDLNETIVNLKKIGIAMHNFHDVSNKFPSDFRDKQGNKLLSWRVHLLPFIDQEKLYKKFHLDEPWDSDHNKTLIGQMPKVFATSLKLAGLGKTTYLGLIGERTMFPPDGSPVAIRDVTDGTSNTLWVVRADDAHAVIWTKPEDLPFNREKPASGWLNVKGSGYVFLLVDASVRVIPSTTPAKVLVTIITRNGGEVVEFP